MRYLRSGYFPEFADQLTSSVFSINTFWRPRRATNNARWLNAAYVDVDCSPTDANDLGIDLDPFLLKPTGEQSQSRASLSSPEEVFGCFGCW